MIFIDFNLYKNTRCVYDIYKVSVTVMVKTGVKTFSTDSFSRLMKKYKFKIVIFLFLVIIAMSYQSPINLIYQYNYTTLQLFLS